MPSRRRLGLGNHVQRGFGHVGVYMFARFRRGICAFFKDAFARGDVDDVALWFRGRGEGWRFGTAH